MPTTNTGNGSALLHELTESCVKCGACLDSCPTYKVSMNECESPRGRIAMIKSLSLQEAPLTQASKNHINNCLQCMRCEAACPANVKYQNIIHLAKKDHLTPSKFDKLISACISHPVWRDCTKWILKYARGPLFKLAKYSYTLRKTKLIALCNHISLFFNVSGNDASKKSRVERELFIDCTTHFFAGNTIKKLNTFLKSKGEQALMVDQGCCGHYAQSKGLSPPQAPVFNTKQILTINTGCVPQVDSPLVSIETVPQFLIRQYNIKPKLSPNVALWLPCSNKDQFYHDKNLWPYRILQGLGCCGASGDQLLRNAQKSQPFINQIRQELDGIDTILCPNYTCLLHLRSSLPPDIHVIHPVDYLLVR